MVRRAYLGLGDARACEAEFAAFGQTIARLRQLQAKCKPMGPDYHALDVVISSFNTAAYHFTGIAGFYGARGDSVGPCARFGDGPGAPSGPRPPAGDGQSG
jgi:hypothetical protein